LLDVIRGDGSLQPQLELSLCSADESLEDLRVRGVQGDVPAGGVGEALEDSKLLGLDVQTVAEL